MMTTTQQAQDYINSLPPRKSADILALHTLILESFPGCRLWFLDGKDATGRIVSNPNIGYGEYTISYADGSTRDFYRVGISANTSGISVYIMGIDDKTYLARTYGPAIGKAAVTGYCIRFKKLADIDVGVLMSAVRDRFAVV